MMKQIYEHIWEDEDLMIKFLSLIREIENSGDERWHPHTRLDVKDQKKADIVHFLVDMVSFWDREDKEDEHWFPFFELAEQSPEFKEELADYLITYGSLRFVHRYPYDDKDDELLRLMSEFDNCLFLSLECSRFWFVNKLDWKTPVLNDYFMFLKSFIDEKK